MRCGDFKESYLEDEKIFQTWFVKFWLAALFLFLLAFPLLADSYMLYLANIIGFAIIGAVGLNLLTGFTGQISLGHAAFIGVGGYATAILMTRLNLPFWVALPIAGFISAGVGMVIGIPSLRVKGLYLVIATLAAQFILEFTFVHWESMTKGIRGINVPPPELGGFVFDTERSFYFITLALVVFAVFFARNLVRTRWGRAFVAIRDRDLAAEIMGINLFRYKLAAFALSSFYAGITGGLWVAFMKVVTPEHFPFGLSIQYLAMVIVGGLGTVLGSIFGAIFMTLVPELLNVFTGAAKDWFPGMDQLFIPMKDVIFGTLIVSFLIFEPHGLAEIWNRTKSFFSLWPFSY
ncbi:branched-chain amino acid ABC transporter permease [Desulfomonile tiedjei]|uniref:Amino acid/amide ABC transporter membrane protein 2, HAAT family n=1 Tax=Desulfomonile tiedjei (strain ATCC 49306 / DSM 6799 / DCB-1) TaxID=706587 RepID=I4C9U9_DESTA|nr:branched-chain amino acid ABC transporter permease [Desulfomonile tiedjei]AFM26340.1 amino acid/amide ABC transporter membrane protein 2, HAAT family [Desulfomonile tiedjei DSM 6799]